MLSIVDNVLRKLWNKHPYIVVYNDDDERQVNNVRELPAIESIGCVRLATRYTVYTIIRTTRLVKGFAAKECVLSWVHDAKWKIFLVSPTQLYFGIHPGCGRTPASPKSSPFAFRPILHAYGLTQPSLSFSFSRFFPPSRSFGPRQRGTRL